MKQLHVHITPPFKMFNYEYTQAKEKMLALQ
jgi:hypothetical protein